ncbi:hypothetical protein BDN70DRAFT_872680 [Pholiota conissans]|uniref:G domain-containing protein n=1 Tax=Pholiota conissans TaxID=109636 RepID=A0A9P5ZA35_9AGAR|nr:hypothetical protein BDN70DRAFT_872680 [Pholiota conissans]
MAGKNTSRQNFGGAPSEMGSRGAVIILLGEIGAGKSTFISVAGQTLQIRPEIGHGLLSCTKHVQEFQVQSPYNPKQLVRLIDTPGFNDPAIDDDEQLFNIIEWLKLEPKTKISGILFLHGIDQERVNPTVVSPNHILIPTPPGVRIVTTKWDAPIPEEKKSGHENDLQRIFPTSETLRFHRTFDSAWEIITAIQADPSGLTQNEFRKMLLKICPKFKQHTSIIDKMKGLFRQMFA